jgi:hypothetical protein
LPSYIRAIKRLQRGDQFRFEYELMLLIVAQVVHIADAFARRLRETAQVGARLDVIE